MRLIDADVLLNRTIINLDSYEVTAMIWAMNEYIHSDRFAEWVRTGGTK